MLTRRRPLGLRRFGRPLGAIVAALMAACEPKSTAPLSSGGGGTTTDDVMPSVSIAVSGAKIDTVDVNTPLQFTVTGTDNNNLRRLDVTVKAGNVQLLRDTTVNSAASTTYGRSLSARLVGIAAGTPLRIIAQATDLAGNLSLLDTALLVTKDTVAPAVSLNQPFASAAFQVGDTVKVDMSAADSSGLVKLYSQLYRLASPTDTVGVLVRTDSLAPAAGTSSVRAAFPVVYTALALQAGNYGVRVRSVDISGNVTRVPQVVILLKDPVPPGLQLVLPTRDTTVTANDTNFIVTMRATDNIQVVRVKAWGVTYRGNPNLGKVDTLLRYDTVSAPVGASGNQLRAGLVDTTVSRRMLPIGQGAVDPETVFVFFRATDQSGNDSTVFRRVFLTGKSFTQDSVPPAFDTLNVVPGDLATVTLGSNFTASAHVTDNFGLARLTIVGFTTRGNPALGVVDTTIRYDSVFAPIKGSGPQSFRAGLTDTVITRNLTAIQPPGGADTLRLLYKLTDRTGRTTTLVRRVILLSGPTVVLNAPTAGASTFPGTRIPIQVSATGPSKLVELGYRIVNANFNVTKRIDVTAANSTSGTVYDTVTVPNAVLAGSLIRVVPLARDVVNPGLTVLGDSASVAVSVPVADVTGPLVYQSLAPRIETGDTLVVRASDPSGVQKIRSVLINDSTGLTIQTDSVVFNTPLPKDTALRARLAIPLASLGSRYRFYSFAFDSLGNRANSVPITSVQPDSIRADTLRGVMAFGRTFRTSALPVGALAGDLVVDRGNNVYISNIGRNQLERWRLSDSTFQPAIPVGSQPWGLTFNRTGDSIFVANSGGTNISVVDTAGKAERRRIKTPGNVLYVITQTIDPTSGVTRLSLKDIIQYSDRPQYIAMSKNGNLYYSTRPTSSATPGTLRRVDPRQIPAATEVQQVTTYATLGPDNTYVIANVDSLFITKSLKDSISDNITIFERPYGTTGTLNVPAVTGLGSFSLGVTDSNAVRLCNGTLRGLSGDCRALQIDVASLTLTDTTFLSAGGDGRAIAFGEGNAATTAGRVMLVIDTAGSWFNVVGSAGTSVKDLTNNASDRVFGLAVDSLSQTLLANGTSAFFADINASALFNLRLQGSFQTSLPGNGVAYHPQAVCSIGGNVHTRVAFVMQGDSSIAVVDCFAFRMSKVIPVRTALYGPMRAVLPTSGELAIDPTLSVKLYCLTKEGLLVIPIRTTDLP
jgi:hypothetical protein